MWPGGRTSRARESPGKRRIPGDGPSCGAAARSWRSSSARPFTDSTTDFLAGPPGQQDRLAVIAGVLAHVKARPARDEGQRTPSLGRLMALPKKPGGPQRVSGLRFRRLIQVPDRVELYPRLVRVLAQLDHTADVWSLARDIYFWGPNVQQAWAYDYYALAPDSSDTKAA